MGGRVVINRGRTGIEVGGTDRARNAIRRRHILVGLARTFDFDHDHQTYILNEQKRDKVSKVV